MYSGVSRDIPNSVQHFNIDIKDKGFTDTGPLILFWLDDPTHIKPEDRRYEIIQPVEEMKKGKILFDDLYKIIYFLIVFQFIFFGIFLIIHKKGQMMSNLIFSVFLFSNSLTFLDGILYYFLPDMIKWFPHLFEIGGSFKFLIPPVLYFYTISLLCRDFRFKKTRLLHLMPFIIDIIYMAFKFNFQNFEIKRELLITNTVLTDTEAWIRIYASHMLMFGYIIAALAALIKYGREIKNTFSFIEHINLSWLSRILIWYFSMELIFSLTVIVSMKAKRY